MSGWCERCSPLGISCDLAIEPREKCPNFQASRASGAARPSLPVTGGGHSVPWTGNALGTRGLSFLASHGRTRLIALAGVSAAGKSTFLTMLYLLIARGFQMASGRFAGSTTLEGWDNLSRSLRLAPPDRPHFPYHTPVGGGRDTGLLHLALRQLDGDVLDLVLTDASGEWFRTWATNPEAPGAEGARWIVDHAHAFILFVDSARLAGELEDAVASLSETTLLAERLRDHVRGRRVGIVWAKADHEPHPRIRQRLEETLVRLFPNHEAFPVTIEAVRDADPSRLEMYLRAVDHVSAPRTAGTPVELSTDPGGDGFLDWRNH